MIKIIITFDSELEIISKAFANPQNFAPWLIAEIPNLKVCS